MARHGCSSLPPLENLRKAALIKFRSFDLNKPRTFIGSGLFYECVGDLLAQSEFGIAVRKHLLSGRTISANESAALRWKSLTLEP